MGYGLSTCNLLKPQPGPKIPGIQVSQLAPNIAGIESDDEAGEDGQPATDDGEYVQPSAETVILPEADSEGEEAEAEEGEDAESGEGAEVIALDKFRN